MSEIERTAHNRSASDLPSPCKSLYLLKPEQAKESKSRQASSFFSWRVSGLILKLKENPSLSIFHARGVQRPSLFSSCHQNSDQYSVCHFGVACAFCKRTNVLDQSDSCLVCHITPNNVFSQWLIVSFVQYGLLWEID